MPKQSSKLYWLFRSGEEVFNRLLCTLALHYRRRHPDSKGQRRILISKLDAIGDFVIFTALLPRLRRLFPDSRLILLVRPEVRNLAETCPWVDEIWTINQRLFRRSIREHLRWYRILREGGFDMAINAVYSTAADFFDCLIGWTGAHRRVGFECRPQRGSRRVASPYFTEYVPECRSGPLFEMERAVTLLTHLGDREPPPRSTALWLTEEDRASVVELLAQHGVAAFAVLFPGARDRFRSWGAANFSELIRKVTGDGDITWLLAGGPADVELCRTIEYELRSYGISVCNLSGETTLRQLACLINTAEFCISSETSAVHIAAAVGTPCLCIIGGGHYGRFYPYPGNPMTHAVTNRIPCFNCDWHCTRTEVECITGVSVEQAAASVAVMRTTDRYHWTAL